MTNTLRQQGLQQSELDNCIFYSRASAGALNGVIAFHVNDLLIGGAPQFFASSFERLKQKYPFKHVKHGSGEFWGKQLRQLEDGSVVIQQKEYSETLECIPISKERRKEKEKETTAYEKTEMRGVLGEVQWLVTGSRPDLAAGCSLLQQRIAV